eukprot:8430046-Lingulodinium_polyedra.AAC.1
MRWPRQALSSTAFRALMPRPCSAVGLRSRPRRSSLRGLSRPRWPMGPGTLAQRRGSWAGRSSSGGRASLSSFSSSTSSRACVEQLAPVSVAA